ncbi:MAG: flavin reductase [Lachnospiraceae bacterium]|nr:flavin reductase [Lachnospiraceae bacterium]MDE6626668.1 flavin reductase [Lachnospiraceae bacterium]
MNSKVMNKLSYGLFVLTAKDGDRDNGCIINTAAQVTTLPNRIIITVNKDNYTHDMIIKTGEFNISVLDESADFDTFKNFGFQSGRETDKFAQITFARAENGIAYLTKQCNSFISGKVTDKVDLGTHTMFVAEVTGGEVLSDNASATYAYYHANIKPSANPVEKKGFVCTVCGYIYEGDTLPADYVCPVCKHGAEDFKPL